MKASLDSLAGGGPCGTVPAEILARLKPLRDDRLRGCVRMDEEGGAGVPELVHADVTDLGRRFKQHVIDFLDQAIKHVIGRGRRFSSLSGRTLGESIFALCSGPLALRLEFKALLKPSFCMLRSVRECYFVVFLPR